jgi:hypothetical protein
MPMASAPRFFHLTQLSHLWYLEYMFVAYRWSAQVLPCRIVHDEQVLGLHELFLNARGRDVDAFAITDRSATARTSDLNRV